MTESLAGRGGVKALCPEELDKHIKRFGNPYPGKHTCDKSLTNIDFEGLKYLFHIYVYTRMYNVQSNIIYNLPVVKHQICKEKYQF